LADVNSRPHLSKEQRRVTSSRGADLREPRRASSVQNPSWTAQVRDGL
jgi:hypothetical protein